MKRLFPLATLVVGLLVGGGVGFLVARAYYAPAPSAGPDGSAGIPTREQILTYLDGRTIDLSGPDGKGDAQKSPHTLRREQIEAIEVGSAARIESEPWEVEVKLVVNTGEGRYAVHLEVQHELIDQQRVFYGHEVKKVTRQ
jgi:hypothetical protein